jgi:S1-C subfamily serine protease
MDHDQPDGGRARFDPEPPPQPSPQWPAYPPQHNIDSPPPPPYGDEPAPARPAAAPGRRWGGLFVAALVGALVGGGIAGGIVAASDHGKTTTIVTSAPSNDAGRASTALAKPGDIRSILARVEPAVVRIDVTANPDVIDSQSGTGTGFIISSDGVIVTNAHVTNAETDHAADELIVTLSSGDSVRGRVVGEDPAQDLAVVKIDRKGLPTVPLGDSDSLEVGDAVVAIGNALGIAGNPTVTSGIVSGLGRTVRISSAETLVDAIQTDAAINPGNSGGPLVDVHGRVIGINTAIADPGSSNNVGFAISISSARPVLDDLRAGRTPRIAYLGVYTQTVTPELARARDLHAPSGAYVALVKADAGAQQAGIRRGDVMIEVDGQRVRSNDDVVRIVRRHRPGDTISVLLVRNDQAKTFKVTLGDLPNA